MTTTVTPPVRTVRPPRKARSNGQWALDGREPLNDNEAFKQDGAPLAVRDRIMNIYGPGGYETIAPDDLNGRFRWWGLYTQRKQGIDGGRTARLDASELSDRYFLQRVRLDGGSLSREQLRVLGSVSNDFARGTADITDRQNIQLHWVEIGSVPELWQRLESVGLTTIEGCGDTPRGFLVSPVAGIAKDEVIDPTPLARAIKDTYLGDPELANLPRKFKTAITGSPQPRHPSRDQRHLLRRRQPPRARPGYDLWVAGALSTAPRLGQRLGAFVTPEDALDVWYGVIRIFRDYGYRRLRNKARLKFLMAEWGPERFRQVLQDDYLGRALPDGPAPEEPSGDSDHIGVHEQKDGRFWVGAKPPVGRLSGDVLLGLADLAERVGSDRVRTTPLQNLLLLDVPADRVDDAVAGLRELGLDPDPGAFTRSTLACTGLEFCKFAIVETKRLAARVSAELDARLADTDLERRITLTVNGCPNSCARIQIADIGLKGQIITVDGRADARLPGAPGRWPGLRRARRGGLGRTVRGLKVPASGLVDYVERLVRRYLDQRLPEESFAQWAHRADEEALQ